MASLNICKRGNNYQYEFELARVNGKRRRITKCGFKTKNEALQAGIKALDEYNQTGLTFKESMISYEEYLDYWYNNYCLINLKYNTRESYKNVIDKYLKPFLGKYRLSSITALKLNEYLSTLVKTYSFSRSYFKNILKVLKGTFRDAADTYGLIRYDPTRKLKLPKMEIVEKNNKHIYSQNEIDIILNRFKNNDAFICAFLTACYTGMRTGEVFALTWNDIDFEKRQISINHNIYDKPGDEKGRWYIGSTKTTTGTRVVPISEPLLKALKNYRQKQIYNKKVFNKSYYYYHIEDVKNEKGKIIEKRIVENKNNVLSISGANFIFTKPNGKFVGTDILKYPFKIIHKELGLENIRFYDLRGSFATKSLRNLSFFL